MPPGGASAVVLLLRPDVTPEERQEVFLLADRLGSTVVSTEGDRWSALTIENGGQPVDSTAFQRLPGVTRSIELSTPYRLASRQLFGEVRPEVVLTSRSTSAGEEAVFAAGGNRPLLTLLSVDGAAVQYDPERLSLMVRAAGGDVLLLGTHGAADGVQDDDVGREYLLRLGALAREHEFAICVEIDDPRHIDLAVEAGALLQVGHRNMQNFSLLRQLGKTNIPILMRRGLGATVEEFLLAAEYVLWNGNGRVLLCEAALPTPGLGSRPRFEINLIPLLKQSTHLPILADPGSSGFSFDVLSATARAAVASGADGAILPMDARKGGLSSPARFAPSGCREIIDSLEPVARAIGRASEARRGVPTPPLVAVGQAVPTPARSERSALAAAKPRITDPTDVLHRTDGTLGAVIESILGTHPQLEVIKQIRVAPPFSPWLRWLLRPEGDLLVRWTRYKVGDVILSRNLAFVDFARVDPNVLDRLQAEELNLGELFSSQAVDKFGFEFGHAGSDEDIHRNLKEGHGGAVGANAYIWRRYVASTAGRIGFLVVESLPAITWRKILGSDVERRRLSAGGALMSNQQVSDDREQANYNCTVDLLERNLGSQSQRPYLITAERTWSYQEVSEAADGAGAGLLGLGLQRGDRVIIAAQDSSEFVVSFWGAMKAGLVPVPVALGLTASDLRFVLSDSQASVVISDPSSIASVLPAVKGTQAQCLLAGERRIEGVRSWNEVCGPPQRLSPAPTTQEDIALWLYTSGTTGLPKAVMHRHRHLKDAPKGLAKQVIGMEADDLVLSVSRMFFAYGLGNSVYLPASAGASVVVNDGPSIPARVADVLTEREPTVLFGVPAFFDGFTRLGTARLPSSVRMTLSAGEALPVPLFDSFRRRFGLPLIDGLGSTEALHHVTSNLMDEVVPGSAGRALKGYEVEVRDRDEQPVPEGQSGELWMKGPTVFAGYWCRPELTARVRRGPWIRTGDQVRVIDGALFYEGRLDDLIKLGGVWVAPVEVEEVLRSHPDVTDAAVAAVDEGEGVPSLRAFVKSQGRDETLSKELVRLCRSRLASFKVPQKFEFVDELPRTPSGKLRRFALRGPQESHGKPPDGAV